MVTILFLIGNGLERSEVIDHMLDIEKCPRKPQYGMASGELGRVHFAVFEWHWLLKSACMSFEECVYDWHWLLKNAWYNLQYSSGIGC